MQAALIPGRRTALWIALAAIVFPSPALELGPVEVRSALGEQLDARIPLRAREGEWFHAKCLALTREAIPGVASLAEATLSVERRRASTSLRIRSAEPVTEPALAFGVASSCAGASHPLGPAIAILIDPPRVDRAARSPERKGAVAAQPAKARVAPEKATRAAAPAPVRPMHPSVEPRAPIEPKAQPAASAAGESKVAARAPVAAPDARQDGGYVLRLSSQPMDLARSRQFDDKSRALLRERLRLLDSDDQVAEMLSMRDNLRRLEARVAELQLKLAAMPQSFPQAKAPALPPASAAEGSRTAPPRAASPSAVEAPAPAVKSEPSPAAVAKAPPAAAAPAKTIPPPAPVAEDSMLDALQSFKGRVIGAGIAILVLLVSLGAWLWSRWRNPPAREEGVADTSGEATVIMDRDESLADEEPIEIASPAPVRAEVTSDAALATRLTEDTDALRRRYLEERFPEMKAGSIKLDDPGSVVKGARLFYEDGAMPRAVELLRFAVEDRPAELRPWLALFEIYRLERLSGEYADLAARFGERHGSTPQWDKVRSFGRELDPANPLYQETPLKSLETIGPAEARRLARTHADPIAENWLEAPMDFENEVLATELRRSLMARARVEERDLVPNPMPALRSVEMFSVG
ncbi:MAG TPA: hypothetical protein VFV90_03670 [Usitatibacter sp.]|nr:hypothetical protein [Usitatibacter sp.]